MRNKLLSFFVLLIVFTHLSYSISVVELYKKGIMELNRKNYDSAIKIFEKITKINESPGAYYNLALSYWNKGEKGLTIYYLKKSLKLYPLYKRSIKALKVINKDAKTEERIFYIYLGSLIISLLLLFFIQFFLVRKLIFGKNVKKPLIFTFVFLFIILTLILYQSEKELFKKEKAIVISKGEVKLYSEPDFTGVPIYKIPEGEEVKIISHYGGWYKVTKEKILLGWIRGEKVKIL